MLKMYKVNGIDIKITFKKRGHSQETSKLRSERNKILQPNRTRIVGKGFIHYWILPLLRKLGDHVIERIQ